VSHRFEKSIYVRATVTANAATALLGLAGYFVEPQPLHAGERVLTAGVLELKKELEDRESK
jgi:hypothetical protein